jgi:hypothetical protein
MGTWRLPLGLRHDAKPLQRLFATRKIVVNSQSVTKVGNRVFAPPQSVKDASPGIVDVGCKPCPVQSNGHVRKKSRSLHS